jgi:hypothetical protein
VQTPPVRTQYFPFAQEMIISDRVRDIGVAYSLSTLWFIVPLKELIYPGTDYYFLAEPHSVFEYLAAFSGVVVLSLGFFVLITLMGTVTGQRLRKVFQLLFVVLAVLAFGPLSYEFMKWLFPKVDSLVSFPIPIFVILICIAVTFRDGIQLESTARNLKLIALWMLPFSFLMLTQALRAEFILDEKVFYPRQVESPASGARVPVAKKVVWIIFDELDYAALFNARENQTDLDNINRLMNESLVAHEAYSPNRDTMESIPAQ